MIKYSIGAVLLLVTSMTFAMNRSKELAMDVDGPKTSSLEKQKPASPAASKTSASARQKPDKPVAKKSVAVLKTVALQSPPQKPRTKCSPINGRKSGKEKKNAATGTPKSIKKKRKNAIDNDVIESHKTAISPQKASSSDEMISDSSSASSADSHSTVDYSASSSASIALGQAQTQAASSSAADRSRTLPLRKRAAYEKVLSINELNGSSLATGAQSASLAASSALAATAAASAAVPSSEAPSSSVLSSSLSVDQALASTSEETQSNNSEAESAYNVDEDLLHLGRTFEGLGALINPAFQSSFNERLARLAQYIQQQAATIQTKKQEFTDFERSLEEFVVKRDALQANYIQQKSLLEQSQASNQLLQNRLALLGQQAQELSLLREQLSKAQLAQEALSKEAANYKRLFCEVTTSLEREEEVRKGTKAQLEQTMKQLADAQNSVQAMTAARQIAEQSSAQELLLRQKAEQSSAHEALLRQKAEQSSQDNLRRMQEELLKRERFEQQLREMQATSTQESVMRLQLEQKLQEIQQDLEKANKQVADLRAEIERKETNRLKVLALTQRTKEHLAS